MTELDDTWVRSARRCPSPNADERPPGCDVELIVVHGISLPPGHYGGGYVHQLFTNSLDPSAHPYFASLQGLRVSSHLLIERSGTLTQFVELSRRAWHAGASNYCGREACNDFSIGIELEGVDDAPYEEPQYETLTGLIHTIRARWPHLGRKQIVGHCDIAPGRKTDPGGSFDWEKLFVKLDLEDE